MISRLIALITPATCIGCGGDGEILCPSCVRAARLVRDPGCFRCGCWMPEGRTCAQCEPDTGLASVSVGAAYEGPVKELILQLKFHRQRAAAVVAAQLLAASLPPLGSGVLVTGVPVSPQRYRERGYSQSELIARQVARLVDRPYAPLLGRTTTDHQMGRGRHERLEQVKGAFFARRRLDGTPVLVVDDVITTGATLAECADTLVLAGASVVSGAAVARHYSI